MKPKNLDLNRWPNSNALVERRLKGESVYIIFHPYHTFRFIKSLQDAARGWFQNVFLVNLQFAQKMNKKFRHYYYGTSRRIVFIHFFWELKTPKRHFEINWPLGQCICYKSLNLINQFSFPVFTAFSKWCRFAMDHNLSWDIWHDKLDQAREGREKWNLYQKQTKQKFHLMMLLSTLSSSFRIEFYTWHLNQNVNLALIMCLIVCTINQIMKWADRIQPHVLAC